MNKTVDHCEHRVIAVHLLEKLNYSILKTNFAVYLNLKKVELNCSHKILSDTTILSTPYIYITEEQEMFQDYCSLFVDIFSRNNPYVSISKLKRYFCLTKKGFKL